MEKQNRTCGECAEFFRCLTESSEMLQRVAPGEEVRALKQAPACEDFRQESKITVDLVAKIRDLAHEAQHRGEASELITAALELCEEYERVKRIADAVSDKINEVTTWLDVL